MTGPVRAGVPSRPPRRCPGLRVALLAGATVAILTGTFAAIAFADDHGNDHGRGNQARHGPQRGHPVERYRNGGYNRGPDVYDTAPPVVYLPPNYYQQPAVSLNLIIPLFR